MLTAAHKKKKPTKWVQEPKNRSIHLHRFVGSEDEQMNDASLTPASARLLKLLKWGFLYLFIYFFFPANLRELDTIIFGASWSLSGVATSRGNQRKKRCTKSMADLRFNAPVKEPNLNTQKKWPRLWDFCKRFRASLVA